MKEEIKQLYKKDKKLAVKVAKVFGYKIKSTEIDMDFDKFYKLLEKTPNLLKELRNSIKIIEKEYNSNRGKVWEIIKEINNIQSALEKYKKAYYDIYK